MSRHEREPLSPEERDLAQRLSRLDAAAAPPSALDARILAAAHAASASTPPVRTMPRRARRRWPVAMGLAASLAVAMGVAWQLRPLPDQHVLETAAEPVPAPAAANTMHAPPADKAVADPSVRPDVHGASLPSAEADLAVQAAPASAVPEEVERAPSPSAQAARDAAEATAQAEARQASARQAAARLAAREAAAMAAPPPAPVPAPVPSAMIAPAAEAPPAPRRAAPSPAADARRFVPPPPPPPPPPAPPAPPPPSEAAVASPAPAMPAAGVAPPPEPQTRSIAAPAREPLTVSGSRASPAVEPDLLADQPLDDRPPASAESPGVRAHWLQRIRELRQIGREDEARDSLREFVRRHPHAKVPADLRVLLEE